MPLTNTYGDITGTVAAQLEKEALKHIKPIVVLDKGAKKFTLPKNKTKTLRLRRAIPFTKADTPLTEGTPPSGQQIRYEQVDITIAQYGAYTPVTDIMVDLHTTPILKDINELSAEQAAKTHEAILWTELKNATNVVYSNGTATNQVNTEFTLDNIRNAVRTLQRNKAKKFTKIVTGGVKENTTPIEAAFICFVHSDAENVLRDIAGFTPVAEYGQQTPISEYEFGAIENVRFISSPDLEPAADAGGVKGTMISTTGTNADVYTAIICGMEAYGCLNLAGKGVYQPRVRSVGRPTDSDPLGQTGSVGWICYDAAKVLNNDWIVQIKHAVVE